MVVPVAKKEGKKPKSKEIYARIYGIKYLYRERGAEPRSIDFYKYIEFDDGEPTRELIFEGDIVTQRERRKAILSVTKDLLDSYKTFTNFKSVSFDQDKRFTADFNRSDNKDFITAFDKKVYSIAVSNRVTTDWSEIFTMRDEDFIAKLKRASVYEHNHTSIGSSNKNVDSYISQPTIAKLIELKSYAEERLQSIFEHASETEDLTWDNTDLLELLKSKIYNVSSHKFWVYQFYNYDDSKSLTLNARIAHESYFSNKEYDGNKYYNHKYLLLKNFINSKLVKEVYLRSIANNNRDLFLMEVNKDSLELSIPYRKLVIDHYGTRKLKIYGLNGSCNDLTDLSNFSEDRYKDVIEFSSVERKKEGKLARTQKYNDEKFKKLVLTSEIPIRENEYLTEHKNVVAFRDQQLEQKQIRLRLEEEEYKLAKKKSLEKYGFFLEVRDLKNSEVINSIYEGDFDSIPFDKEDLIFSSLLNNYMNFHSQKCDSELPTDKVEIYKDVCSKERVTKDGFGVEIRRTCIEWVEQGTGYYTSPGLYSAYKKIKEINDSNTLKHILEMASAEMNKTKRALLTDAAAIHSDMERIIELNGCDSKALKRFEENLIRFANDEAPIRLELN